MLYFVRIVFRSYELFEMRLHAEFNFYEVSNTSKNLMNEFPVLLMKMKTYLWSVIRGGDCFDQYYRLHFEVFQKEYGPVLQARARAHLVLQ